MKNSTQIVKRNYFIPLLLLFFAASFGQNGIIGTAFGALDWSTTNSFSAGAGSSRIYTATPNSTGDQYFRLVRNWSGDYSQFGPSGCVDTPWNSPGVVYGMSVCGSGAFVINFPNMTDNYVIKTPNGDASMDLLYFRIQGAISNVSTVVQSPLATNVPLCSETTVTATLDAALSTGQAVYLRYTNDAWSSSTVVAMTGSGTTYTAAIPSLVNSAGANVSYYVFTSGDTGVALDGSNADFYTINLNSNGGSNYGYTVSAAGTTSIPDANFEQALIDLGLDCSLDGQVFTSNISGVTYLDVSNYNIADLTGIEGFTSLYELTCESNLLTSLDVSALPTLRNLSMLGNQLVNASDLKAHPNLAYLDCDDNLFTSIDVSTLTNLTDLYCSGNQLTSLDVRGLSNLQYFECTNNPSLSCILVDDVATANTATTTIAEQNYPSQPYYYAKDATAKYSYCDCDSTTTWTSASGGSWSNGIPTTGTYAAIIAFDYSEAANINACSLTVNTNANVTIPSGYNVTLNAPLIVETGSSFTLSNNSNLVQTNKNSVNSGAIKVNRNSNPLYRLDYTMWSSPVAGQNLLAFSPLTSVIASPPSSRFYTYDSATDLYNTVVNPSVTSFSIGSGYLIRMPNTDPTAGYDAGTATLSYPGLFTGVPNNGDVTLTVASGTYNAIGNPYPSVVNANDFINGNSTDGTLYFWRKTNGASGTAYASYNLVGAVVTSDSGNGGITPKGHIQVGQGFIVNATSTELKFTNAMREATPTSIQFLKTKKAVQQDRIWLNLTNASGVFSQALIGYIDGATVGVDNGYDGKYINDSSIALTSNINGEEYTIQGRPAFDATDVVPLNFKTDAAGDYTIAIDHTDGLFAAGQEVYLVDKTTNTETNLKSGSYTFTAAAGVDNARFTLKYQKTLKVIAPVFNDDSVTVYRNNGTLFVNSGASAIQNIKVYDMLGRLIAEQKKVKANTTIISNLKATHQALIVKVTSEDNKVVNKKVVN
ncbi:MAG: T9SS sorting signal type C domain-containing protein [Flavobacterium sp.]|uniref:T9SS sorting signal type C domain-containing protein n=1 Tax=Flavobacterium sp. TaxID=239 RepID=UPI002624C24D|nr:T9SS sorting signal type C domain-containing protein [Flavobacterium sp.]MDD5150624.1 T9SS sorting signal type C domain-containing protein [Flavobacterium sp.]